MEIRQLNDRLRKPNAPPKVTHSVKHFAVVVADLHNDWLIAALASAILDTIRDSLELHVGICR